MNNVPLGQTSGFWTVSLWSVVGIFEIWIELGPKGWRSFDQNSIQHYVTVLLDQVSLVGQDFI